LSFIRWSRRSFSSEGSLLLEITDVDGNAIEIFKHFNLISMSSKTQCLWNLILLCNEDTKISFLCDFWLDIKQPPRETYVIRTLITALLISRDNSITSCVQSIINISLIKHQAQMCIGIRQISIFAYCSCSLTLTRATVVRQN